MKMTVYEKKYTDPIGKEYNDPRELLKYLKSLDITIEDIVILLLGITEDNAPIYGRTLLVKEVFLTIKEVIEKYAIKYQDPKFISYQYGPYSFNLIDAVESMAMRGYIYRSGRRGTKKETFSLSDKGLERYKQIREKLEKRWPELLDELKEKRRGWDELGTDGILKYVYQNYPEYLDKSKIYKKYEPINWGKGRG